MFYVTGAVAADGANGAATESLNRDLASVNEWFNLWGMKLNASKTKTMKVSISRTMHPH